MGIYELLLMDNDIRQLALKNTDSNTIKQTAIAKGMRTLRDDGAAKVLAGHHHDRRGHDGHRRGQAVTSACRSSHTKASTRAGKAVTGVKDADNLRRCART